MKKLPEKNLSVDSNPAYLKEIDTLYKKVSIHIENARQAVQRSIDSEMVKAYWLMGNDIMEEEQKRSERAEYGSYLIKSLSERLTQRYGKGFSISTLKNARQFYLTYSHRSPIGYALRSQSESLNCNLGWIHYRALMRIGRPEARSFYEIEAAQNNWSGRELERQIHSLLFERLLKSKDKKGLLRLATHGQEINSPVDAIKDPVILEFLDLPESHRLVESKIEQALIDNLQAFLLELGSGFAFVKRQKRLTLDGDNFYTDLVFYHTKLKCYTIVDIKTKKLTHEDIGQMQLYVNYFDAEVKDDSDNPTIGLMLCTAKNDSVVKYTLGKNNQQIFASKYKLYLPTEEELIKELQREITYLRNVSQEEKS